MVTFRAVCTAETYSNAGTHYRCDGDADHPDGQHYWVRLDQPDDGQLTIDDAMHEAGER